MGVVGIGMVELLAQNILQEFIAYTTAVIGLIFVAIFFIFKWYYIYKNASMR